MKDLLVLGNGPVNPIFHRMIPNFHEVIRFNHCYGWEKEPYTTILSLVDMVGSHSGPPAMVLNKVHSIWVPNIYPWSEKGEEVARLSTGISNNTDLTFIRIDKPSGYNGHGLSSGMTILKYLILRRWHETHRIFTAGFSFAGSDWHDWDYEFREHRLMCSKGLITQLKEARP